MTYTELITEFKLLLDSASSLAAPGFEDSEIDTFLNKAQDLSVEEWYKKKLFGFLKDLLTTDAITSSSYAGDLNNSTDSTNYRIGTFTLPAAFRYHHSCTTSIYRTQVPTINSVDAYLEDTDPITKDQVYMYLTTGDNKPIFKRPKIYYEGQTAIIVGDAYTYIVNGSDVNLSYIKEPTVIDSGTATYSDFEDELYKHIIQLAVDIAMNSIDYRKAATAVQVNQALTNTDQ